MANGSGWILDRVQNIYLNTSVYEPIRGKSYIETPKAIAGKHAIVNIQNKDDMCFKWAVLSDLHPVNQDAESRKNYEEFQYELVFTDISFPVNPDDIIKFERLNNIPISVYTIRAKGKQVYPLYYTKQRD